MQGSAPQATRAVTHCDEAPRAAAQRWRAAPSLSCDVPCEPPPLRRAAAARARAFVEKAPVTRNRLKFSVQRSAQQATWFGKKGDLRARELHFELRFELQLDFASSAQKRSSIFGSLQSTKNCQPPGPLGSVVLSQNMDISGRLHGTGFSA